MPLLVVHQLEQLPDFINNKRKLAENYRQAFAGFDGVCVFAEPDFAQSNYWLNTLLLDKDFSDQRDVLLDATNSKGIMTRPVWTLMHELEMYQSCPRMDSLATAEDIEKRLINIPSSAKLAHQYAQS